MGNSARLQMPDRVGGQRPLAAVDDAHLAAGQRTAVGVDHLLLRIALAGYGEAGVLRHAPAGEHVEVHLRPRPLHQQARNRRTRAHPGAQRAADLAAQRFRQVDEIGKERRRSHAEACALALDQRRGLGGRPQVERHRLGRQHDRHQDAVEEAGLVGVGRAHEHHIGMRRPGCPCNEASPPRPARCWPYASRPWAHRTCPRCRSARRTSLGAGRRAARPGLLGWRQGRAIAGKARSKEASPLPPTANTCCRLGQFGTDLLQHAQMIKAAPRSAARWRPWPRRSPA